jgi:hypothetical protein
MLILLAEAAPRYRQQFAALTTTSVAAQTRTASAETAPVPVRVPAPRTGTAGAPRTARRPDADLIAALAGVPRDPDGTVPIRRAAAALGCGTGRARRLLTGQGLLRTPPAATTPTPRKPAVA